MESVLDLRNVSLTYYGKKGETKALSDINLSIYKGEFFGIVGPSGSGKTTLLSILAGIMKPTEGEILSGEENLRDITGYTNYRSWRLAHLQFRALAVFRLLPIL